MRRGFLHVAQRDSGVETGREQCSNRTECPSRSGHPEGYSPSWRLRMWARQPRGGAG
jgi:hypothetical protein